VVGPLLKTSNIELPVVPAPELKLELAPLPVEGAAPVGLNAELGAGAELLGALELPEVLSACPSATRGHESATNVAFLSRLEIMEVVEENPGAKNSGWVGRGARR
jgi:hypothetical protein